MSSAKPTIENSYFIIVHKFYQKKYTDKLSNNNFNDLIILREESKRIYIKLNSHMSINSIRTWLSNNEIEYYDIGFTSSLYVEPTSKPSDKINDFILSVATKGKGVIISRLKKLKTTESVEDGGMYHQDTSYSQIRLSSSKPLESIETWLYNSNFDYVGVTQIESN